MISFLYDASGQATWNLAGGPMSGSSFTDTLKTYCCGETLSGPYQANRQSGSVGSISITWSDPQHGSLTWPGGTVAIQRFSFTSSPTVVPPQAGSPQTGWWWDPDESGVGYAVEIQGNNAFFGVFAYNSDGTPTWALATSPMSSPTSYSGHWDQYCCGYALGGAQQSDRLVGSAGNVSFNFSSITTGTMTKPSGATIPIERFQFASDTPVLPVSVVTFHNDNQRTGQNLHETILTPSNVNSNQFGKKAAFPVDGQVYAQPLVVSGVTVSGIKRNVVYVATEHDSVYAFDADGTTSAPLWQRSFINPSAGVIPAQSSDTEGISPELGVTSTPVIDTTSNTMYVLAMTNEPATTAPNQNLFRLHALDLSTGAEKFGGPVLVKATVQGTGVENVNGTISINPGCYQRAALLLQNGTVYASWGHCWHGWVVGFNASTLAQTAVYNTSPNGKGAAIWMGGGGPAADANGNLYLMTGVDADSTTTSGYSNAFLKLSPNLQLLDYFIPANNVYLTQNDADIGSGGPMIPPDNSSSFPQEIVGGGKDGRIFILNRNDLGGMTSGPDRVVQEVQSGTQVFDNFFDVPTYWNGSVYMHAENDVVHAFQYSNGHLSSSPTSSGNTVFGVHGATAAISADANRNGILWELQVDGQPNSPAILRAYLASNVATELYNSAQAGTRDAAGPAVKFTVPTVANGKVYVPCGNQLVIYGLF